jgi:hypothetical protein
VSRDGTVKAVAREASSMNGFARVQ